MSARRSRSDEADELREEYRFDYARARPNRFASEFGQGRVVVVLDDDIAQVFRTPEAVKAVLRALIATMPAPAAPHEATEGGGE
jgi:hypothetical protein